MKRSAAMVFPSMLLGIALVQGCSREAPGGRDTGVDGGASAEADGYYERIERLAEGVWVIRQNEPFHLQPVGNVTVVEHADGLVMIDGGGSPGAGRRIADLVEGVSGKPVKALLITHWHGDHTLGVSAIRERWPQARILSTERTRANLLGASMARYAKGAPDSAATAAFLAGLDPVEGFLRGGAADTARPARVREGFTETLRELELYRGDVDGLHLVEPTETFEHDLVLDDPERPVEISWPGPANTDGDAIAWLPRQRIVVTGDLVVLPVPFGFGSYPAEWIEALTRVRDLDFDVLVPGHGAPQRDPARVDGLIALIADMRSQMAGLAADVGLEEARERMDVSAHRQRFAGDDPWLALWFRQYWVVPFTESLWKEARGIPITQGGG